MPLAIAIIALYFVPSIVAYQRKKRNASSILVVNFFLGWTFIGWIVALSWSLAKDDKPTTETVPAQPSASPSSELIELFKMKEKGAITDEEFQAHKAKLLK